MTFPETSVFPVCEVVLVKLRIFTGDAHFPIMPLIATGFVIAFNIVTRRIFLEDHGKQLQRIIAEVQKVENDDE